MNLEYNQNQTNNENNVDIDSLINSIKISNLNEYYDIETSIFKKRCDRLNLLFFNESESLPPNKDIPPPYNKLFIILFKEISIYIEEIERLNKQLRKNNKSEKESFQKNNLVNENNKKINMKGLNNVNFKKSHIKSTSNSFVNSSIIQKKINKNNIITCDKKEKIKVNEKIKKKENIFLNDEEIEKNKKKINKSFINKEISIQQSLNNEINEEIIERCMNQYEDELNNLQNLEEILLNQKKIINSKKKKLIIKY